MLVPGEHFGHTASPTGTVCYSTRASGTCAGKAPHRKCFHHFQSCPLPLRPGRRRQAAAQIAGRPPRTTGILSFGLVPEAAGFELPAVGPYAARRLRWSRPLASPSRLPARSLSGASQERAAPRGGFRPRTLVRARGAAACRDPLPNGPGADRSSAEAGERGLGKDSSCRAHLAFSPEAGT